MIVYAISISRIKLEGRSFLKSNHNFFSLLIAGRYYSNYTFLINNSWRYIVILQNLKIKIELYIFMCNILLFNKLGPDTRLRPMQNKNSAHVLFRNWSDVKIVYFFFLPISIICLVPSVRLSYWIWPMAKQEVGYTTVS